MPRLSPSDVLAASAFVALELDRSKRQALAALAQLWRVVDPRDIPGTLTPVLPLIVQVMHQQQAAGRVTAWSQAQLAISVAVPAVTPGTATLPLSGTRDGRMPSGATFEAVIAPTTWGVLSRIGKGATREQALDTGRRLVTSMVGSVGHDEARATTADVVRGGGHARVVTGYARQAEGPTCDFCLTLATRGPVYSEESAGFEAHAFCDCSVYAIAMEDFTVNPDEWDAYQRWSSRTPRGATSSSASRAATGTPSRAATLDAQIASYDATLAAGNGTQWMRDQMPRLNAERDALLNAAA
jgi:hypothetical protein